MQNLNNNEEQKTILKYGKIEGNIIVPDGIDPSSVVIQVGAVNKFNLTSEDFYTTADKSGHFIFENTFPVGSSLNLVFWDKLGLLNKRTLPVYVSKYSGTYSVYLEKTSVTTDIALAFGDAQDYTKAGLCGKITGLTGAQIAGSEVFLQENSTGSIYTAKYFNELNLPSLSQNYLSENGNFCFFNVVSSDNSYLYSLGLKLNDGSFKTFFVYLPSYTFNSFMEFDAQSAVFRPVQFYSWNHTSNNLYNISGNSETIDWHPIYDINFSTSYDFASTNYNKNSQNDTIYFPLGDEFLNINYNFSNDTESRYFIFQPRSALFNKDLLTVASSNFSPGQSYVDKNDPLILKVFDPKVLKRENSNYIAPMLNTNYGSAFFNFDATDFPFEKKEIKITLKNISGEEVSIFQPLKNISERKEISGFFYNIPQGLFQLFVTVPTNVAHCDNCTTINTNEKLLWTALVESLANKTQILTNMSDNKIVIENKLSAQEKISNVYVTNPQEFHEKLNENNFLFEDNYGENIVKQIFPAIPTLDYLIEHSLFYNTDENKLCALQNSRKIPYENLYMDIVPIIDVIPHFHWQQQGAVLVSEHSWANYGNFSNLHGSHERQISMVAIEKKLNELAINEADQNDTGTNFAHEVVPWYVI